MAKRSKSGLAPEASNPIDPSIKRQIEQTVGQTVSKRLKNKEIVSAIEATPTPQKNADAARDLLKEQQSNAKYHHIPMVGTSPGKTVAYVQSIISAVNSAVFYGNVALFCDGILEDEAVSAALTVRLQSLVSSRIDIIPASEDPKALKVRDLCEKHLPYIITNQQIVWLMRWGLLLGNGFANVYMDDIDGYKIPRISLWHPRYARWDLGVKQYKMVTENMGEVFVLEDDPSWLLVRPYGDFYPWFQAMIKPLANIYLKRHSAIEWWARLQEAAGAPMFGAIVPPYTDPTDEAAFVSELQNHSFAPIIRLPQGQDGNRYEVEVIQANAEAFKGFEAFLKYCDSQIYRLINGQDFSMGASTSILSSAENPGRAVRQEIRRHDARTIEPVIFEKLLKPWCIANFGDASLTPSVRFDIEDKEDQLKKTQSIQTLMDAFNMAGFKHIPLDVKAILNDLDLPIADIAAPQAAMNPDTSVPTPSGLGQPVQFSAEPQQPDDSSDDDQSKDKSKDKGDKDV
jgi:hypothetical protein